MEMASSEHLSVCFIKNKPINEMLVVELRVFTPPKQLQAELLKTDWNQGKDVSTFLF